MRFCLGSNQTLAFEGILDTVPHLRAWIPKREQKFRLIGDVPEILDQIGTDLTRLQVFHFGSLSATLKNVGQDLLKFGARHFFTLPSTHRRAAFSALLCLSKSRSFIRALCN